MATHPPGYRYGYSQPRRVPLTAGAPTRPNILPGQKQPDHQPNYRLGQRVIIRATEDNPCDGRHGRVEWIRADDGHWTYGVHLTGATTNFYGVPFPAQEACGAWQLAPDDGKGDDTP